MSIWIRALVAVALPIPASASDISVPEGFEVSVVFEGEGSARHIAISDRGDIYVSSRFRRSSGDGTAPVGILALRDADHDGVYEQAEHFGAVEGTGIRFYDGFLYATTGTTLYRYSFESDALTPGEPPEVIVRGMPEDGFSARPIAFDDQGRVLISLGARGNTCVAEGMALDPCPDLYDRAGVWRYRADRAGQVHPGDGDHVAIGVRDAQALAWNPADGHAYIVIQGRNGLNNAGDKQFSAEDSQLGVAEELHRVTLGADFGWPYTHFDPRTMQRMKAPEYGGQPAEPITDRRFATPIAVLPPHGSPLDIVFDEKGQFPGKYRGGAFVAMQGGFNGPNPQNGYEIWFVPYLPDGEFGEPEVFADGFAGEERTPQGALHRPSGLAISPDGALLVVDSKTGRIWRIEYSGPTG